MEVDRLSFITPPVCRQVPDKKQSFPYRAPCPACVATQRGRRNFVATFVSNCFAIRRLPPSTSWRTRCVHCQALFAAVCAPPLLCKGFASNVRGGVSVWRGRLRGRACGSGCARVCWIALHRPNIGLCRVCVEFFFFLFGVVRITSGGRPARPDRPCGPRSGEQVRCRVWWEVRVSLLWLARAGCCYCRKKCERHALDALQRGSQAFRLTC